MSSQFSYKIWQVSLSISTSMPVRVSFFLLPDYNWMNAPYRYSGLCMSITKPNVVWPS
jgi:hypothetical protein